MLSGVISYRVVRGLFKNAWISFDNSAECFTWNTTTHSINPPHHSNHNTNPYGETHPKKPAHQANTLTENELLKSSHALWPIEKSNRIPPTVKKNFRLFSGFTWNTNSSATMRKKTVLKYHPPTTQPPRPTFHVKQLVCCRDAVFHVKQANRHKISEDAICCSTAPHSFSAFHVKQLVCCRDAVFHVKHSAEYPPNPQWHSTSLQPTYPWYRFRCGRGSIPWNCGNREEWNGRPVFVIYRLLE